MMRRNESPVRPPPLLENPELGQLLREASLEYADDLHEFNEPAAFRRLSARLARDAANEGWAKRRWPVLAVALAAAAVWWTLPLHGDGLGGVDTVSLTSELPLRRERGEPAVEPGPAPGEVVTQPAELPAPVAAGKSKAAGGKPSKQPGAGPREKSQAPALQPAALEAPPEAGSPPPDCLGLARNGAPRDAERCFSERARGSGLEAEMALYEVARLRVDVLGDSEGALSALRQYGERFPRGSLRREADMFRVELLARLGRAREALTASDELLSSAAGSERAADLYLLRGNVYRQTLRDPAAAEEQYARAEALGGAAGAQAAYLRGVCFEALGNHRAAIASYRRYTSVPGRPQSRDALARLQRLEQLAGAASKDTAP